MCVHVHLFMHMYTHIHIKLVWLIKHVPHNFFHTLNGSCLCYAGLRTSTIRMCILLWVCVYICIQNVIYTQTHTLLYIHTRRYIYTKRTDCFRTRYNSPFVGYNHTILHICTHKYTYTQTNMLPGTTLCFEGFTRTVSSTLACRYNFVL